MDELDLLLEELAQNPTNPRTAGQAPQTESDPTAYIFRELSKVCPVGLPPSKGKESESANVYSALPAPVEAPVMSPNTATKELDSILEKLLGLGLEVSVVTPCSDAAPLSTVPRLNIIPEQIEILPESNSVATPPLQAKKSGKERKESKAQDDREEKKSSGVKGTSPGRKQDAIDHLLGGLNSDMEKMGVRTTAKGHCASCGKCIVGKMISALGEMWHPEHFVCAVCEVELSTSGFYERDGRAYCESDYHHLFSPRCAYCMGPILQNILTAMDNTWHPEHFFCAHCGDRFGPEGFLEKDARAYCVKDFYHLFAPRCSGCGHPVRENYLTAANGTWHPDCFVCADCLKPFADGSFLEMDGRPLCSHHYHSRQGTLCGGCGEAISGRCISALERKFHPEHFVCAFCLRQLSQGVFQEQQGRPYCAGCHSKLFV